MSKINEYLPKVLQPVLEFQIINSTLDTELTNMERLVIGINKEVIAATATDYGISRWEKTLGIVPGAEDSLETRRFRVQNILNSKLPYTVRWLKGKLTEIVGNDTGWTININYDDYTVTIVLSGLDVELMGEVQKQLRGAIPANMVLEIGGEPLMVSELLLATGTHLAYKVNLESDYMVDKEMLVIEDFDLNIPKVIRGVTFTKLSDNTIKLDGTVDGTTYAYVNLNSSREIPFVTGNQYTASCNKLLQTGLRFITRRKNVNIGILYITNTQNTDTTVADFDDNTYSFLELKNGTVFEDYIITLSIRRDEDV